ncbi:aminotransferase class I/II-fold pyridoxal phosphate-dependent enzyme [Shewanella aestuarii]|uniref:8-amino-7-oxononanoate synthase n=1 Tax=Shewanella aestuarii TaxID=1028752 RepID=A0A6G9QLT8_9GAMM|nr:8-amino-7-oxononanoate synthase [Shewanella aestuarii]QIR14801.1 8-amino-7-oxononanoate synthase [Shewanella aestuarii]
MSHPVSTRIAQQMAELNSQGLVRSRRLSCEIHDGVGIVDFSHNDYLGLASEPLLAQALYQGAQLHGVGSKASPLVSGYSKAHQALEQKLCEVTGHQACMLFCSGFSANNALMKTLFTHHDTVIADKLVHASIIDGVQSSGAKLARFVHNDIDSATRLVIKHPNSALVTESVFSMDGDCAPIKQLSDVCQQYNTWLIVDDAHGFGVVNHTLCNASFVDIQVVTFGKALGCQGAAILASQHVIDYLVANSRHYIYSTALSPANAYLALSAINLLESEPQRLEQLNNNIYFFRQLATNAGIALSESITAIQPVIIGSNQQTMAIATLLAQDGFSVGAIRSPTVPKGSARLRITINSNHTQQQITDLVNKLATQLHSAGLL